MRWRLGTALRVAVVLLFLTYLLEPLAETAAGTMAGPQPAIGRMSTIGSRGGTWGADVLAVERAPGQVAAVVLGAGTVNER